MARELWLLDGRLRERVENHALLRVLCRDLDKTAAHPANYYGIIEEKSARVVGVDQSRLNASLRKDSHLRLDRNV